MWQLGGLALIVFISVFVLTAFRPGGQQSTTFVTTGPSVGGLALILFISVFVLTAFRPGGQQSTTFVTTGPSVGTSSAQVLGSDGNRSSLVMCNPSAAATIYWTWARFGPAVVNGAGSHPLAAGGCAFFDNTRVTDGVNAIATAAATPMTIDIMD